MIKTNFKQKIAILLSTLVTTSGVSASNSKNLKHVNKEESSFSIKRDMLVQKSYNEKLLATFLGLVGVLGLGKGIFGKGKSKVAEETLPKVPFKNKSREDEETFDVNKPGPQTLEVDSHVNAQEQTFEEAYDAQVGHEQLLKEAYNAGGTEQTFAEAYNASGPEPVFIHKDNSLGINLSNVGGIISAFEKKGLPLEFALTSSANYNEIVTDVEEPNKDLFYILKDYSFSNGKQCDLIVRLLNKNDRNYQNRRRFYSENMSKLNSMIEFKHMLAICKNAVIMEVCQCRSCGTNSKIPFKGGVLIHKVDKKEKNFYNYSHYDHESVDRKEKLNKMV
ncbi:MAG: hypothetical protein FWC41_04110 [Firmicutes bacterium]|nr:hypothetical protein [Bacillota bacterium]